jgi:tRNA pseudouridine55 synthase
MSFINGILPVDKPVGPTSHDVVAMARRALKTRRIGHTGTLDPFASGLLLLCLGPSTRLAEYVAAQPKSYVATMRLGTVTDTDDHLGEPLRTSEGWSEVTEEEVRAALDGQLGEIQQIPPRFSAKRVAGERMYDVARRGEHVELSPVTVTVREIELLAFSPPEVRFRVDCSSGTYIRAIARDVGAALGVGAHLTQLRRTRIGTHDVGEAIPVDRLDEAEAVEAALLPPSAAVSHLPRVPVDTEAQQALRHGGSVPLDDFEKRDEQDFSGPIALVSPEGELLAIGERVGGRVQPRKVFL